MRFVVGYFRWLHKIDAVHSLAIGLIMVDLDYGRANGMLSPVVVHSLVGADPVGEVVHHDHPAHAQIRIQAVQRLPRRLVPFTNKRPENLLLEMTII